MATSQKQDIELGITRYEYGEMARRRVAVLQIETSKYYNGGLISDAGVYWVGDHSRQSCISLTGSGGDYGKRLKVTDRNVKATQKAIDKQHAEVFTADAVSALVEAARRHYAGVIREGIDGHGNTYPKVEERITQ
jgi:hypothetical protein